MTETTTPTDEVADQSSSDIRDESLLERDSEQNSAVEHQDSDSSESNESDTDSSSSESNDDSSDEDKGLAKFAKSQGIDDLTDLTEREIKLLKVARDNVREQRKQLEEAANQRKVEDEIKDLHQPDENDGQDEVLAKRLARLEVKEVTDKFWNENSDDRKYESEMAKLLLKEKEEYGPEAARLLANNLPRLLREAKASAGAFDSDAARDAGRREERERLRKIQEGGADNSHASQSVSQQKTKIDADWVENVYQPSNPEHRKLLDEAISRGDLY
jgi:hypothetical protein